MAKNNKNQVSKEKFLKLYEKMVLIRNFELKAEEKFLNSEIPGFIHLYIGEEAIATGIIENLKEDDFITSTHRGHGHMLAKGADPNKMMAELYGKKDGYCKGKGGSMHIMNFDLGVLGANGEVAGGLPIAAGAGLAIKKITKTDQVVVAFFGDGASNRGAFHEALNWASIYNLPILFVVEYNNYASTISSKNSTSVENISERAAGYNIEGITIDGNDVLEVYNEANKLIKKIRNGSGPILLECKTYRLKGHFVGDPEDYRDKKEVEKRWDEEPINRFENYLFDNDILDNDKKEKIWNNYENIIKEAVKFAENCDYPKPEEALEDLFADDSGYDYK
ncbi:MAG: thiamine pyrophosphate-dependent dehydrogenase E1 component subunit alpha [Halanaerobiales bacterium]|nr:thiamine pyrophosphate-dependent dehydrogenase E1 component subunit alpha [Halanaerobiales bacterium]